MKTQIKSGFLLVTTAMIAAACIMLTCMKGEKTITEDVSDTGITCSSDIDCNDGNLCNGEETCNLATYKCANGTPLTCTSSDACHTADCDPATGCINTLIDNDRDGFAPASLGSCGKDCDDSDNTIYNGAPELCDGKDNNCNGSIDEEAPWWYVDCDIDGYAASISGAKQVCSKPAVPGTAVCGAGIDGDWTTLKPVDQTTTDCNDSNKLVHPNQTTCFTTPYSDSSYDYDCNGVAEKCFPSLYVCSSYCIGSGWVGAVPPCGSTGTWKKCAYNLLSKKCEVTTTLSYLQSCK